MEPGIDLILISRHLERLGDHATYIAEERHLHRRSATSATTPTTPSAESSRNSYTCKRWDGGALGLLVAR